MVDRTAEDAVLVARARGGCTASADRLVRAYESPIVEYLGRLLARGGPRTRSDAEDVAQETFIRMLRSLDGIDPRTPFAAWLFTIARRAGLNHLRTERRHARRIAARAIPPQSTCRDGPLESAVAAETRDRLWGIASRTLPKRQFAALWLRYVEEMPVAGIARTLGSTATAVKLQLLRGRRRLEPVLADAGCGPHAGAASSTSRRMAAAGAVSAAGACLLACLFAPPLVPGTPPLVLGTPPLAPPAPAAAEAFAIESVPLPDEIGERIVAETAALAAEAVGLPRWETLVASDPMTTVSAGPQRVRRSPPE